MVREEYVPPCGLYCGVCAIMYATRDENLKFRERLAPVYGVRPEDLFCAGCLAPEEQVWQYCRHCPIKSCARDRAIEGCHECDDWPCEMIENFPLPVGRRVMMRAIPRWREVGTEQWVAEEEERYHCPACGHKVFRGAKRCNACKKPLDLD